MTRWLPLLLLLAPLGCKLPDPVPRVAKPLPSAATPAPVAEPTPPPGPPSAAVLMAELPPAIERLELSWRAVQTSLAETERALAAVPAGGPEAASLAEHAARLAAEAAALADEAEALRESTRQLKALSAR